MTSDLGFDRDTPYRKLLSTFIEVNQLAVALGGDMIGVASSYATEIGCIPQSEYGLFNGTAWQESQTEEVEDPLGAPNYKRDEVHAAVDALASTERNAAVTNRGLTRQFPEKVWQDEFPGGNSINYIISRGLSRMRQLISDDQVEQARKTVVAMLRVSPQ